MSPQQFKAIRESFGLTQGELGTCLGVTQKTISQYEIGFRVPGPTVRVIMVALDQMPATKAKWLLDLLRDISEKSSGKPIGKSR